MGIRKKLKEKLKEALQAVLPIIGLVLLLSFTIAPISPSILLCFLIGGILLIAGIVFFTLGAELAMSPMGERVGTAMTQSKKLWVVVALSFLLGFIITISEPDLQVLAQQVPAVPNLTLILAVACGVGVFLVVALLRMLFSIALPPFLVCFYAVIFILAFFVPKEFLSVAFDSGGVTTGPMTVPFIMALGVGISATRSDRHAADDSFGLVALCSVGPILAVMVLFYGVAQWNSWFPALLYISDRGLYPLQMVLREVLIQSDISNMAGSSGDVEIIGDGLKYATMVVATLPIMCLYPFLQKYFVKGIMIGSLKG